MIQYGLPQEGKEGCLLYLRRYLGTFQVSLSQLRPEHRS